MVAFWWSQDAWSIYLKGHWVDL